MARTTNSPQSRMRAPCTQPLLSPRSCGPSSMPGMSICTSLPGMNMSGASALSSPSTWASVNRTQISPVHDAIDFQQRREVAEVVGHEGAELEAAIPVELQRLLEARAVVVETPDGQLTLQAHELLQLLAGAVGNRHVVSPG